MFNIVTLTCSPSEDETSSSPPTPESPLFSPFGRAQTISSIHTSHLDQAEKAHRRVASEDRNVPINLEFKRELDNINQSRTPSGKDWVLGCCLPILWFLFIYCAAFCWVLLSICILRTVWRYQVPAKGHPLCMFWFSSLGLKSTIKNSTCLTATLKIQPTLLVVKPS